MLREMLGGLLALNCDSYDPEAYARHRERYHERKARDPEAERCVAKVLGRMAPAARPYLSPAEREFLEGSHAGRH